MNTLVKTLIRPLSLLKRPILIFGALSGLATFAFAATLSEPREFYLKCILMCSAVMLFILTGAVFVFLELKGVATNTVERVAEAQLPKVIKEHKKETVKRPLRKRPPRHPIPFQLVGEK